jgi:hypothetical protein
MLDVWLPLLGEVENQGLEEVSIINNSITQNDEGKLGKCVQFGNNSYI